MSLTIGLLGDIYLARDASGDPFAQVNMAAADGWFANLEAPLTDRGNEDRQVRSWTEGAFKIRPQLVSHLRGLTAVSVANNHALDFGRRAYLESLAELDTAGIGHAGGGADWDSAHQPYLSVFAGVRVAFLAYTCLYQDGWPATRTTPGMATVKVHTAYEAPLRVFEQPGWPPIVRTFVDADEGAGVAEEVRACRAEADVVVVSVHWGLSTGDRAVIEYQRELGRLIAEAGADVVFGHQSHSLQPMTVHDGVPIFFSLGNIVFDYDKAWRNDPQTAAVRVIFGEHQATRVAITPLLRDRHSNPVRAEGDVANRIIDRILGPADPGEERVWDEGDCIIAVPGGRSSVEPARA